MTNYYFDNSATTYPKYPGIEETLGQYLRLGGTNGERVIFTPGATWSINMVIHSILKNGGRVLISPMEHNAVMRPLRGLEKANKISIEVLTAGCDGLIDLSQLDQHLQQGVDLMIVNHQSNVNGVIQPVEQIKKMIGTIPLLVDGAQSAGETSLSFDESDIDYYATSGHKGLLGLPGSGLLLVGKNTNLEPLIKGGTGSASESEFPPKYLPDRLEVGTPNIPGILSIGGGISWKRQHQQLHNDKLDKVKKLLDSLQQLDKIQLFQAENKAHQAGTFSLQFTHQSTTQTASYLLENGAIETRVGLHCAPAAHKHLGTLESGGTVRISPGLFHSDSDFTHLLKFLKDCNHA
jgi:selenocysteine lyase/cysteine desulfurase